MARQTKTKKKSRKRLPHEKKPILPGVKSMRGQGEIYDETKKTASFGITPTAKELLEKMSDDWKISQSELLERIIRFFFMKAFPENE